MDAEIAPCRVEGCDRGDEVAGYCHAHYERRRATGREPVGPVGRRTPGGLARLSVRVRRTLDEAARARAAAEGHTLSAVVEAALSAYLSDSLSDSQTG